MRIDERIESLHESFVNFSTREERNLNRSRWMRVLMRARVVLFYSHFTEAFGSSTSILLFQGDCIDKYVYSMCAQLYLNVHSMLKQVSHTFLNDESDFSFRAF